MAVTLNTLQKLKHTSEKFAALTVYNTTFADAVSVAGVEGNPCQKFSGHGLTRT